MSMYNPRFQLVCIATLLHVCLMCGCAPVAIEPVTAPPPEVTVAKPEWKPVTEFYEYIGRTESPEFVEIRARVTGYLTKINFTDGKEVEAGEPLFEIDRRPYEFTLNSAQARLHQAESQLKLANLKLDRTKELNQANAVSQQDLDEAIQMQANAAGEIQATKAAIAQAELDLGFCNISAPIAGRLSRASVTVGNLITAGQANAPALTTIASVDPIHVLFDVDEAAVLAFRELRRQEGFDVKFTHVRELNQKVHVALANEKNFPHEGVLDFIDNRVQTTTGTLRVRAELQNKNREFAPGFFVRVRVPFGTAKEELTISERAILSDQNLKYVLVAGDDDIVERRDVELGMLDNGMRAIKSGLKADDRVIVNGVQRARAGAKVHPRESTSGSKESKE